MQSYDEEEGVPIAGVLVVGVLALVILGVVAWVMVRTSLLGYLDRDTTPDVAFQPLPAATATIASTPPTFAIGGSASTVREYQVGEPIVLASRPGVSFIVTSIEWRDRLKRQDAVSNAYLNPDLGRFLVVTYQLTNGTSEELDPAVAIAPLLEDGAGLRYRPDPLLGILDANQEPAIVVQSEMIGIGSSASGVRFFDVPNNFAGGHLRSEEDNYQLAVEPAQ